MNQGMLDLGYSSSMLQLVIQAQPTVAHTQRLTITIDTIDDVNVVAAGTNGLDGRTWGINCLFNLCNEYWKCPLSISSRLRIRK